MAEPSEKEVEAAARAIAIDFDLDPELGYPAWKIEWIIRCARAALLAAARVREEK